jgi:hypothetical protein
MHTKAKDANALVYPPFYITSCTHQESFWINTLLNGESLGKSGSKMALGHIAPIEIR